MKHNVLLMFAVIFLQTAPVFAADELVRSISVRGEAREEVAPNQAILSGQLVSNAKQLAEAKQLNDKLAERVLSVAKQFDIPKEKVSASNVTIAPQYAYENNKQVQTGYIVSRNLSITMDKLEIHEKLLSTLVENGIDQINGVQFGLSDVEKRSDALRVKAVANARSRAESLAMAAGAKLGKVITITTEGVSYHPQPMMARSMKAPSASMAEMSEAPSLPGLTSLHESVSVTYELE